MEQAKPDQLPAQWLGALWFSWYRHRVWSSLEAPCQALHPCSGVTQQPHQLCKTRGKSCRQSLSFQHPGVLFSLKFTSAQQPGTRIPWRPDLLLLPSGKAEFQIDLLVLPSRCCRGMTSKLKTARGLLKTLALAQCDRTSGQGLPTWLTWQLTCCAQEARWANG